MVDELAEQGVPRAKVIDTLEQSLSEPLGDEVSAEQAELLRRKRIAEENRAATDRLAALSGMMMQDENA